MLKQILGEWKPKWYEGRWKVTLIALPIVIILLPLLILAIPYLDILNDMATDRQRFLRCAQPLQLVVAVTYFE